ncbi:GGDEF domain-containing protein [Aliagarivorans marinus]|uniref:GGDEF domain-containing protein n=1 Tax=Aliagarivorans marinus TaxID=561965 RepID=UPI000411CCAB|nr:GGDEF domain-containing protein [Aliagarivorans marinus]
MTVYLSIGGLYHLTRSIRVQHLKPAITFVAINLSIFLCSHIIRLIQAYFHQVPQNYIALSTIQQYPLIVHIASNVGLAIGFLWIWQLMLEHKLKARAAQLEIANSLTEQLKNQAEQASLHDALTGAGNRRKFEIVAQQEYQRSQRYSLPISVLLIDVDHFKSVNDNFGHSAGDHVLKNLVKQLSTVLRDVDSVFRWGGEEFLILLPNTHIDKALLVAERIRGYIEEQLKWEQHAITASIGVAERRAEESIDGVISAADNQLYCAKRRGRNQVACRPEPGNLPKLGTHF